MEADLHVLLHLFKVRIQAEDVQTAMALDAAGDCGAGFGNLTKTTLFGLAFFFQFVVKVLLLTLGRSLTVGGFRLLHVIFVVIAVVKHVFGVVCDFFSHLS